MTSQMHLIRPPGPATQQSVKHFPHNHLQSLFDGFVDFSGVENCAITFKGLSLNSKKVHEEFLFLACAGVGKASQHGVAYAGEAINSGASCIVWEPTEELIDMPLSCPAEIAGAILHVPLIKVADLHEKVGEIAARFYQHPSHDLQVIGITGTNGKTSTAHFIAQMMTQLQRAAGQCAVIGTLGNGLYGALQQGTHTTPDAVTVQQLMAEFREAQAETLVMEVSSHALSQGRVNGVEFDCAVLTNLSRDHLDYHGDMQAYAAEKLKLFQFASLKQIIVNQDDAFAKQIITSVQDSEHNKVSLRHYSRIDSSADYFADDISHGVEGISFSLMARGEKFAVKTQLVGDFNIDNLLAAIAVLNSQGYELSDLVVAIAQLTVVPGRMEKIQLDQVADLPLLVIDYAHTPDALTQALQALKAHSRGKLICVFGCGGDRDQGKRPLMAQAAEQYAEQIIVTSDNPRSESPEDIIADILAGFESQDSVVVETDREKAIFTALELMTPADVLLIAGKGHEDYQEINGLRLPFSDKDCVRSFYQQAGGASL